MSAKLIKSVLIGSVFALLAAVPAAATTFEYEVVNCQGAGSPACDGRGAGQLQHFFISYDDVTNILNLSFTVDKLVDAFSLVVTDGDNPKDINMNTGRDFAHLFGTVTEGGLVTTAHAHNFMDNYSSIDSQLLIGTNQQNAFGINEVVPNGNNVTFNVAFDTSILGNFEASFGERVGLWFHFGDAIFDFSGTSLASFAFDGNQGFLDGSNLPTNEVPEPSTMLLLGSAMVGVRLRRKKQ